MLYYLFQSFILGTQALMVMTTACRLCMSDIGLHLWIDDVDVEEASKFCYLWIQE